MKRALLSFHVSIHMCDKCEAPSVELDMYPMHKGMHWCVVSCTEKPQCVA